jgi:predicted metalloprotease with PDZ domain
MPIWTPGEYRIQNHGKHVRNLRAALGGAVVESSHPTPST